MKKFLLTAAAVAALGIANVQAGEMSAPNSAPRCLRTEAIDNTHVVNPSTILFRMQDGTVWRNDLRGPCNGLNFNGFVWNARGGEICGPGDSIRVLRSGQVCILGQFSAAPHA
jgi:hypothetical protein